MLDIEVQLMNTFDAVNKAVSAELPSMGPLPPVFTGNSQALEPSPSLLPRV